MTHRYQTTRCRSALAAVLSLIVLSVQAQATNPFIGKWEITFAVQTKAGIADNRSADLVIKPDGGTWQTHTRSGSDPCVGKEVPVVIDKMSEKELTASVKFSALHDFCKDLKLVLTADEQGKVSGRRGNTELTLKRK